MKYIAMIGLYDSSTKEWKYLNDMVLSWVSDLQILLEDYEPDSATITFELPKDQSVSESFINSRLFTEGTKMVVGIGYGDSPSLYVDSLFNGIIVSALPEFLSGGVKFTIVGADPTILLKGLLVNTKQLTDLAKKKEPVEVVKYILNNVKCKEAWKKDKEGKGTWKILETETPNLGFSFTDETIPPITEEEKKFKRFVQGSSLKDIELDTSDVSEFGLSDEPNLDLLKKAGEMRGFDIRATYIETIRAMEVACNRLFWYDSRTGLVHFDSVNKRWDGNPDSEIRIMYYGDGRYHENAYNDSLAKTINRLFEFVPDYSAIDTNWFIRGNLVSVVKDASGKITVTPLKIHDTPVSTAPDSESTANNTAMSLNNYFTEKSWLSKKAIAPDAYQMVADNKYYFKIKEFNVTASAICIGNPYIRPRDICRIDMVGLKFSGYWIVKTVGHRINKESGFSTSIVFTRNVIGVPDNVELDKPKESKPKVSNSKEVKKERQIAPVYESPKMKEFKRKAEGQLPLHLREITERDATFVREYK